MTRTPTETAEYLRTLPAIRDRCSQVFELAKQDKLQYFEYHPENEVKVTDFCVNIIHKNYGTDYSKIPPHGRWRHSDAHHPRIAPILAQWTASASPPDSEEVAARLIDHFTVSVLLDAGAGPKWVFTEPGSGVQFRRSEGLGVAAVHMWASGLFSGDKENKPYQVDATGLASLTPAALAAAFQVTEDNPLVGLEGRTALLARLADALRAASQFFGPDARPGGLVAYLKTQSTSSNGQTEVPMSALWTALITGLQPIWPPGRGELAGVQLGDVWPCPSLGAAGGASGFRSSPPNKSILVFLTDFASLSLSPYDLNLYDINSTQKLGDEPGASLVPFHKLTGWLAYSLREPLERILGWRIKDGDLQTGLPEYRNGGLFLDLGVLRLRSTPLSLSINGATVEAEPMPHDAATGIPRVLPSHPAIVEWRAMTVVLLDRTLPALRTALPAPELTLAQALESATWSGGRAIAQQLRPAKDGQDGGGPPIEIVSDGTVF
ncbi:hypothetical protein MVEN_01811900 [Mycena venus]|uniref:DUF1688-domain-containing protein n=1 Tax=Mycena venus TaxID=2733690 RepID=A0A8H6XKC4_9AGAR|nr:hypothetical protein MVEN_01811900 [Mycena venus]